jgi:DNA repair photolyase
MTQLPWVDANMRSVRWDGLKIQDAEGARLPGLRRPPVVRTFDAPDALGVRFHEVEARSALNRVPGTSLPFHWSINPYRGCMHGCVQCFARPTHRFLDLNPREDFEREIVVKVNLPELLRAELARPSWRRDHVALGTNTDPYQWVEGRYRLMVGIWEAMIDARNPCSVLTRSPLLLRDVALMRRLVEETEFAASLSIPTLEERAWRATEPRTPHPRKRIEAVAELNRVGIPTGVLIAPLMPGINDSPAQVEEILGLCAEAGATSVSGIPLHLRGEVREIFLDWLRDKRPDLVARYETLYAGGANMPAAERRRLTELARSDPGGDRDTGHESVARRAGRRFGAGGSPRSARPPDPSRRPAQPRLF